MKKKQNSLIKSLLWTLLLSSICTFFLVTLNYFDILHFFELKTFDERIQIRNKKSIPNKEIAVVLADEASLQALQNIVGRWPWPRSLWADVISFLESAGAKAVLFDILFTETQEARDANGQLGADDLSLIEASKGQMSVTHAFQLVIDQEDEVNKQLLNKPLPRSFVEKFSLKNLKSYQKTDLRKKNNNFYIPLPELFQATPHTGVVEFSPDSDGVYRSTTLVREYMGHYFPVLSLASVLDELKPKNITLTNTRLDLDNISIPLQENKHYFINLKNNFENYSVSGILATIQQIQQGQTENLMINPDRFKDKIIFIGASAVGIEDLKTTSVGQNLPGVYLHASILDNILQREWIIKTDPWISWVLSILFILLTTISVIFGKGWFWPNATAPLLAIFYTTFNVAIFNYFLLWMPLIIPLSAVVLSFIISFIYINLTEKREKRKTRKMLAQYVSPDVLTEVMDQEEALTAEVGSTQNLTVFFSDIRSFTTFSEENKSEQVVEQLNYYLTQMIDIIFETKGTLDKFIGDAVMAFWGAPVATTEHPFLALKAALKMRQTMPSINAYFASKGYPPFNIGMGINTGEMILGNIGSDKKLSYTVIGDHVNLGSRLEGLTKNYHVDIIISENTFTGLLGRHPCVILDRVQVKGKHHSINLYYPLSIEQRTKENIAEVISQIEQGFMAYKNREWDHAFSLYKELSIKDRELSGIAQVFMQRCQHYKEQPPEKGWDGHFIMETK